MIEFTKQQTIIIIVMMLMYITFIFHIFNWFKHKIELSHLKSELINLNTNIQQKSELQNKEKQNHKEISLMSIINVPIIRMLRQKAQPPQSKINRVIINDSNYVILAASLLSAITCVLLLSFCLDEELLSVIIQILKQSLFQSLNLQSQKPIINQGIIQMNYLHSRVLYHNKQQQLIYGLQLISVFAFMILSIRTVWKIDKQNNAEQQQNQTYVNYKTSAIDFILRLIMILSDPWFISIIVLEIMIKLFYPNSSNNNIKYKININTYQIISYISLILLFAGQLYYFINSSQHHLAQTYIKTIFPTTFTPQSNLMWILYAHMFTRYLPIYQIIMFLLPLSFAIPLSLLKINYQTKIICQYFVIIFTTYYCTDLHLYLFWVLVFFNVNYFISYKNHLMKTINKSLALIAFLGSILFILLYKRMVTLFLTTWMVNIGYPFLFGCIAWALIVVWMTELIRIQLQQCGGVPYDSKQSGKIMQMIHQFKLWIKNKLWTKNH